LGFKANNKQAPVFASPPETISWKGHAYNSSVLNNLHCGNKVKSLYGTLNRYAKLKDVPSVSRGSPGLYLKNFKIFFLTLTSLSITSFMAKLSTYMFLYNKSAWDFLATQLLSAITICVDHVY